MGRYNDIFPHFESKVELPTKRTFVALILRTCFSLDSFIIKRGANLDELSWCSQHTGYTRLASLSLHTYNHFAWPLLGPCSLTISLLNFLMTLDHTGQWWLQRLHRRRGGAQKEMVVHRRKWCVGGWCMRRNGAQGNGALGRMVHEADGAWRGYFTPTTAGKFC